MNLSSSSEKGGVPALQHCSRCKMPFRCGTLAGDAECWCATLPTLPPDALRPGEACLCPVCLADEIARVAPKR